MKSFSTVCTIVIIVNLCLVWSVSFEAEKTFSDRKGQFAFNIITGTQGTNLTCPMDPVCSLTSIRCKSNADCYPAMPVCCIAKGIRCCNIAGTAETGQPICPGNNPPPACRNADVCTADNQCFGGERCCRTYFGGRLLNFSCCINATRGPQCPATVAQGTCADPNQGQCGSTIECAAGQVCCAIGNSATIRCCVFPVCPAIITTANQCFNGVQGVGSVCAPANCLTGQICCYPGTLTSPCCVVNPTVG